jgi:CubicO group peptidase (beta-lactamase class C family)
MTMYRFASSALGAVLTTALACPAQFTEFEQAIADFDVEVATGVAEDAAGCVSVAVFIGDEVIWSNGYGWADIENRVAATAETIGRIGSISKSFTAVAMVQLAERGILQLDDPVSDYFTEISGLANPPAGAAPITFRMLASHTAGLIREPRLPGAASGSIYHWEDKILESIPHTSFGSLPGTAYAYSNIGFGMLGLASSRAADVPFMDLVTDQIFKPLGMTSSTFILTTPELWARMSVGYNRNRRTGEVSAEAATRDHFGRGYKVPNGGIYSTVGDLAKFAAAMMGENTVQILSAESRKKVLTLQDPAPGYGLGFSIREGNGVKIVGHGGSVAGYNADLSFELNSRIGVAMLRTTGFSPQTGQLLRKLVASTER